MNLANPFARPLFLLLLPLAPLALLVFLWAWNRWERDAAAWTGRGLWPRLLPALRRHRRLAFAGGLALAVAATALALAEPRWGTSLETLESRGADVVFVVDSSRSMGAEDVRPSRLAVARILVRQMLEDLHGVPVGLVQAEGDGVSLSPLSLDTPLVSLLVSGIESGTLPQPGTALAPALTRAYQLFQVGDGRRVVVLLSDGEDHLGGLEEQAARLAQTGVVVHTVGIGTAAGARIPILDEEGRATAQVVRDAAGEPVVSRLQGDALRHLAETTGGLYVAVERADFDPSLLVQAILSEPAESEKAGGSRGPGRTVASLERRKARFQWPLAVAFLAVAALLFWAPAQPLREGP